jgi:thymidine kinase
MSLHNKRGVIEVIFGPMFSGKSTELMRRVNRWKISKKNCLVINYSGDSRYTDEAFVATHDQYLLHNTII